jgi:hypothetical protein
MTTAASMVRDAWLGTGPGEWVHDPRRGIKVFVPADQAAHDRRQAQLDQQARRIERAAEEIQTMFGCTWTEAYLTACRVHRNWNREGT